MRDSKNKIKDSVKKLVDEGLQLIVNETPIVVEGMDIKKQDKHDSLHISYNSWYTRALPLIKLLANDRYEDFVSQYKCLKNRSKLEWENYTISDYLLELTIFSYDNHQDYLPMFASRLSNQVSILKGVFDRVDSVVENIEGLLQAELFDSELNAAKELQNKKHFRAAGVIAGVVLERHLKNILESHSVAISKAKPALSDLNDALKTANIYDVPTWRRIQSLADIRNLCAHGTSREPTEDEIEDIITGVDRIIKSVF